MLARVGLEATLHLPIRRPVSAQYCFSEKEHAEITLGRNPQSGPEIRASHRTQEGFQRRQRRGEARGCKASGSRVTQGADPQERRRSPQEPASKNGQVIERKLFNRFPLPVVRFPRPASRLSDCPIV